MTCSGSGSLSLPLSAAFLWAAGRGKVSMATEDRCDRGLVMALHRQNVLGLTEAPGVPDPLPPTCRETCHPHIG